MSLPSHLLRSGEIEPRSPALPAQNTGDWEEKTVVDDSQLSNPKEALSQLLHNNNNGDEELTIDEPQRPVAFPMGPSAAPKKTVRGPGLPPNRKAAGKLVVIAGNDRGREFPLTGKTITVGRGIDNDVVLTDIAVSRKHMSLALDDAHYKLIDAGSGNGTLLNDEVQTGARQLRHGDRIEIGNTVFRFENPASAGGSNEADMGRGAPAAPGGPAPAVTVPGPSGPAAAPNAGAQNPAHSPAQNPAPIPPLQSAGAAAPGAQAPGPAAPLPFPAGAPAPGAPTPGAPPAQQPAPGSGLAAGARAVAVPRAPVAAAPGRPRTTALAGVVTRPRNTLIGAISTLVGIAALATVGLLLGDDEYLASERAAADSFELPSLEMLPALFASGSAAGGMPDLSSMFDRGLGQGTLPGQAGEDSFELPDSAAQGDGAQEEESAAAPPAAGEGAPDDDDSGESE